VVGSIDEVDDLGLLSKAPELQNLDSQDPFVVAVARAAVEPESPFTVMFEMFEPSLSAADGTKVWVEWFDSLTACREKLEALMISIPM
jgi:hypothetical protein